MEDAHSNDNRDALCAQRTIGCNVYNEGEAGVAAVRGGEGLAAATRRW